MHPCAAPTEPKLRKLRLTGMTCPTNHLRRLLAPCLLAVLSLLLVAGCSSGGTNDSAADSDVVDAASGGAAAERSDPRAAILDSAADSEMRKAPPPETDLTDVTPRAQIKIAAIGLTADNVDAVLQQLTDVAVTAGGEITSENTSTNRQGEAVHSRMVLRVPVDQFESAVSTIDDLGLRSSLRTSVEDVTAQVADTDSRVQSAEDSIASLRRLFAAAKKLGDIIVLERELSHREADLEALQAQQRALADQTALSTINVTVSQTTTPASPGNDEEAGGFVAGVKSGWDGLVGFVRALSHGLGLVLPIGTVLVLTVALGWFLVRRLTPWLRPRANE